MELRWGYLATYIIAVPLYMALTFAAPVGVAAERYQLTEVQLYLVQATILLPVILIWFAGLRGVSAFQQFVNRLGNNDDRPALQLVLRGIAILVFGLILTTLYGTLRPYLVDTEWYPVFQITRNYLSILLPLMASFFLYRGSRKLLAVHKFSLPPGSWRTVGALVVLLAAGTLTATILSNPYRSSTPNQAEFQSYFLNDPLLLLTIVLPSVLFWLLGLMAALNIFRYASCLDRPNLQQAYRRLAQGIVAAIVISVGLQMLAAAAPALARLGLAQLLGVVYLLLAVYGLSFMRIASGARQLEAITARRGGYST